jgi:hypothetical protein
VLLANKYICIKRGIIFAILRFPYVYKEKMKSGVKTSIQKDWGGAQRFKKNCLGKYKAIYFFKWLDEKGEIDIHFYI